MFSSWKRTVSVGPGSRLSMSLRTWLANMQLLASDLGTYLYLQLAGTSLLPQLDAASPVNTSQASPTSPDQACLLLCSFRSNPQATSDRQIYTFTLSTHSSENWQPRARLLPDLDSGVGTIQYCELPTRHRKKPWARPPRDVGARCLEFQTSCAVSDSICGASMGESRPIVPSLCDVVTVER